MSRDLSLGAFRNTSLSLFTDLYELTMAQAYWQAGRYGPGVLQSVRAAIADGSRISAVLRA